MKPLQQCIVICLQLVFVTPLCIDKAYPETYVAYKLSKDHSIQIDGKLNEQAWTEVSWSTKFKDIEGEVALNPIPRKDTKIKLRWDDTYLYVGAMMDELTVWANQTKHNEVIFHDNDFEIFVDPSGSTQNYKEIEINALNKIWDLMLPSPYLNLNGRPICNNANICDCCFDMISNIKSAVYIEPPNALSNPKIKAKYWIAEIALPLDQLMIGQKDAIHPNSNGNVFWRINFSRVEYNVTVVGNHFEKTNPIPDNWVWQPLGVVNMHLPERWGYLQFSSGKVNTTETMHDSEWAAREILFQLYDSQQTYKNLYGVGFATSIDKLVGNTLLNPKVSQDYECDPNVGAVQLFKANSSSFAASVRLRKSINGCTICRMGFINDNRNIHFRDCMDDIMDE